MGVPNRGPEIAAVTILFLVLTWIVVSLRWYVKIRILKKFHLDDYLVSICLFFFTAYGGYGLAGVYWGAGRHIYDLPLENIRAAMKVWYFCEIFYAITAGLLRFAVGIFLLHFANRRIHRNIIIVLNGINLAYHICFLAANVYLCIPLSYFWTRFDPGSKGMCFDPNVGIKITIGVTVVAAVTDWVFGLLPIWIMWDLRLSRRKKLVVCGLLGLGVLASAAPLIRFPYLAELLKSADYLWATTDIAIWSVVELGIGIVVISLPTLRPLFTSFKFFANMSQPASKDAPSSTGGSWGNRRTAEKPGFEHNDTNV